MSRTAFCHIASSGPGMRTDRSFPSEDRHVMSRTDDGKAAMRDMRLCSDEEQEQKTFQSDVLLVQSSVGTDPQFVIVPCYLSLRQGTAYWHID